MRLFASTGVNAIIEDKKKKKRVHSSARTERSALLIQPEALNDTTNTALEHHHEQTTHAHTCPPNQMNIAKNANKNTHPLPFNLQQNQQNITHTQKNDYSPYRIANKTPSHISASRGGGGGRQQTTGTTHMQRHKKKKKRAHACK